jgi:beta-galactosidase
MYIDMSSWGTGYVFVNGHNLGRYWSSAGPQTRLYCPGVWLNNGGNTIVVFEFTLGRAAPIDFFGSSNLPYNVTSPVATVLVSGGVYTITNSLTGLLLGAYEGGTSAGPRLGITAATGGSEQQWIATSTGAGHWLITNAKSGLLMNVQGQDTANGTPLDLWSAGGRANQRFAMMPRSNGLSYAISSVQSARVVDVGNASTLPTSYGSTNVSAITLREDKRSASQSWIFTRIR